MTLIPVSQVLRSILAYGLAFLALELPGHFHLNRLAAGGTLLAAAVLIIALMPISTLSGAIWGSEQWWHPLCDALIVFTLVLLVHLRWHLSASYLIAVAVAIAVATVLHALTGGSARR